MSSETEFFPHQICWQRKYFPQKNHSPPPLLQVKWMFPNMTTTIITLSFYFLGVVKGEVFFNNNFWLCHIASLMCLTACYCAFSSLFMLSANRYLFICHKKMYFNIYGSKRKKLMCLCCWVMSISIDGPFLFGFDGHHFDTKNHQCIWDTYEDISYTVFVAVGLVAIPLSIMIGFYVMLFREIYKTKKSLLKLQGQTQFSVKAFRDIIRSTSTTFCAFLIFLVCWGPYGCIIVLDFTYKQTFEIHLFFTLLAHVHSSCNFTAYYIVNKHFRTSINEMLTCKAPPMIFVTTVSSGDGRKTKRRQFRLFLRNKESNSQNESPNV